MKISNKDIEYLTKVLNENNLTGVEYSEDDYKIKLFKEAPQVVNATSNNETLNNVAVDGDKVCEEKENISTLNEETQEIKCPLIGHFYLTKTPLDPPIVKVGDKVEKGDVIGILQAMKVSNEIKSTVSGEIVEILVESGQFVDYDCVLMRVKVN